MITQVISAVVDPVAQLADSGRHSPGLRGLPDLRRGQSPPTKVHQQARQVN